MEGFRIGIIRWLLLVVRALFQGQAGILAENLALRGESVVPERLHQTGQAPPVQGHWPGVAFHPARREGKAGAETWP